MYGYSLRRKNMGSFGVAFLIDISFAKQNLDLIYVISEKDKKKNARGELGAAQKFWRRLGFKPPTHIQLQRSSKLHDRVFNPYKDSELLVLTRDELVKNFLTDGPTMLSVQFKHWAPHFRKRTWDIKLKSNRDGPVASFERMKL